MRRLIEQGKQVAAYERYKKDKEEKDLKVSMQKSEAKKGKGKGEQNAILKAELKKE